MAVSRPGRFTTGIRVPAVRLIGWVDPRAGLHALAMRTKIPLLPTTGVAIQGTQKFI